MSALIDRLQAAMNAHDLDGAADLFHPEYRSEQPAHPARAFERNIRQSLETIDRCIQTRNQQGQNLAAFLTR